MTSPIIFLIKGYQILKPTLERLQLTVFGTVSHCRYSPSCSQFTINQIKQHGTIAGLYQGIKRFSTCI